jgi:uncharacterized membrane protein HdeD (DUF308 family)
MSVEERRYGAAGIAGLETLREKWGWFLALGIALIVLGIAAISTPQLTTLATELFIGWILVIGGVVQAVNALYSRRWGGFFLALLVGVLYLVVGLLLLSYPLRGVLALTLVLGMFFLIEGAMKITISFALSPLGNWGLVLASGIASLIIAFLILANWPSTAAWAIGLLLGLDLLFSGTSMAAVALSARRAFQA